MFIVESEQQPKRLVDHSQSRSTYVGYAWHFDIICQKTSEPPEPYIQSEKQQNRSKRVENVDFAAAIHPDRFIYRGMESL